MAALIKQRRVITESAPSPDGKVLRLEPTDDPASVADQFASAARVEVIFPKFGDGRGFSIGRLLRERYGYKGELRAVGHITRDHLFFLESVGFDAFELREGEDPHEALAAFNDFSESYQASPARPQPLFRRRAQWSKLEASLREIAARYAPVSLASSLQAEDMIVTDVIGRLKLPIGVFVLDTGRLHDDTLALVPGIRDRYNLEVEVYEPQAAAVLNYVHFYGRDAFYGSAELRHKCCEIRKVEPLARALAGKRAWITGQRRGQASNRAQLLEQEFDAVHGIEKFNPLADWSEAQVWEYIHAQQVPYNRLYDQGYRSIGCAPCTRPVLPGEDVRAGRWWWEKTEAKECGLHVTPDGRLARAKVA